MATAQYFDNYSSTLASGYTSGGVSLVVTSATLLPSVGNFELTVDRGLASEEQFLCTARSGTTLTVVGAQGNTSASNHSAGATVDGAILGTTTMNQIRKDVTRSMTAATFDALASTEYRQGDVIKINDSPYEAFYNGSSWEYYYGSILVTRPPSSGWTWDNQGSSTISSVNGFEHAEFLASGGFVNMRCRYRTAPATPYTVTVILLPDSAVVTNVGWNIGFRDSSGKLVDFLLFFTSFYVGQTNKWTNTTSLSAAYKNATILAALRNPSFLRMTDDGTNLLFYTSADKINWVLFDSRLRTDFFTSGPTQIFYGSYTNGGQSSVSLVDWTIT